MNLNAKLTLDGLVRALRWKGLQASDLHQTRGMMGEKFEPMDSAAQKIVRRVETERRT